MSLIQILLGLRPPPGRSGRSTVHRMPVKPRRPIIDAPDHEDEDEGEMAVCQQMGFELIQGYLTGRPGPIPAS